ncbi:M56 family metallopeptidase [Paraflavitalea sp. CAU 1676]|uniref:M56 family metallopeptidase n=1 Tax=Paraflavitalea sp. CAU 1676 TaxID=3032598 RepID=UPI0023DB365B|nr:M56 family metallopeptidase [Paraflavitalea sp. CAU 1676]MDF2189593.1 M56 family metallopeptidase [Paraflavitalea sp. CAU 1676]
MQLLFMNPWLPASLMKAICWTLVHSLWQGLILAAVAGLFVLLTRKRTAALRYNLLATLFMAFMVVVGVTFLKEMNDSPASGALPNVAVLQQGQAAGQLTTGEPGADIGTGNEIGLVERFAGYFNEHASLVVAIWFIIFLAKALKLFGGLVYIQRIKHYKVKKPAAYWTSRLEELAAMLGVQAPVKLMESALVTVPMVVGMLKPVILVPMGLLANMPAAQVEAILLHELAHIRRRDFLVNLAQSFAETLFFFNPAVLWLSSLLRQEREHCCDDMAIGITQSKTGYIHALVSFQEYQLENNTPFAMAFPGKKDQLLNRVKRIVDNSHKSLNPAEKTFLAVCMGLIIVLSMAYGRPASPKELVGEPQQPDTALQVKENSSLDAPMYDGSQDVQQAAEKPESDAQEPTSKAVPDTTITPRDLGFYHKPYDAKYNGANVVVNNKQPFYPVSEYKPYEGGVPAYPQGNDTLPVLKKGSSVMTGVITTNKDGKEYKIVVDHNKVVGLIINGQAIPNDKISQYKGEIDSIFRKMQVDANEEYENKQKENEANLQRLSGETGVLQQKQAKLGAQVKLADNKLNLQAPIGTGDQLSLKKNNLFDKDRNREMKSITDEILADLVKEGIVTETNPLMFRLTNAELVVNHVQQPKAIHERFQQKYVKKPKNTYSYSKEGTRTSSTIIVE